MLLDRPYITKKDRRRLIIGLAMTAIGGLLYSTFPSMLNGALKSQLQVKEGNDFTKAWNKNPFPISLDAFIFNLENPEEFAAGAKAKLREMGPYSYNMWLYKEIISFNSDQTKVRFWESQSFEFREDSPNKLSDKVTILNFPVYALANAVRSLVTDLPLSFALQPVAIGFVNILFMTHRESLIKELTVGELLNGYPFSILNTIDTVTRPLTWFGIQMPDTGMPDNKFGLLWTKNFTKGGPFEAYSGQKGTQLLQIVSFKDKSTLNYYDEPQCNAINGTEGSTLEVDVSKEKTYYVFATDTCRTFDLTYDKDTWVNGIPTYRFIPNPKLFAAPSKNPANKCYCRTPDQEEWCDGIFDLGLCLNGAPAAYSFPHFYEASSTLRNNVENMHPDPEQHQGFIDVEPFMGAPIQGAEKLQMNAIIKPIPYLAGFRNFRDSVLPLMWMRKGAVINDEFTLKLRLSIWPLYLIFGIIYIAFFGGMVMLGAVGYRVYRKRGQMLELNSVASIDSKRSESREPLQLDFNQSVATPLPASQTPVPMALDAPFPPTAPINQTLHEQSANYSAVSRRTGTLQQRRSTTTFSSGYLNDRTALPPPPTHTAQYRVDEKKQQAPLPAPTQSRLSTMRVVPETNRLLANAHNRASQRATVPAEQMPYPRLTYSSTTYQGPRVGQMSAVPTRYGPLPPVERQEPKNASVIVEPAEQGPYPRLTYSSTTFQGPRVGQMSAVSTRYGPVRPIEKKAPEMPVRAKPIEQEHYPRLTYSSTTFQAQRAGPMSTASTRYVGAMPQAAPVQAAPKQAPEQQSRKLSLKSSENNNNVENNLRTLPEDEFYDDEIDFGSQFEMPQNSDYNIESTWTSVNEVIRGDDGEGDKEEKVKTQPKEESNKNVVINQIKKAKVEDRVTWSPPGGIE